VKTPFQNLPSSTQAAALRRGAHAVLQLQHHADAVRAAGVVEAQVGYGPMCRVMYTSDEFNSILTKVPPGFVNPLEPENVILLLV
jgi:hypothetical protein